jgi:hypothetical protein
MIRRLVTGQCSWKLCRRWGWPMLLSDLRDRTRQDLLEFAWRQWAQMGISAHFASPDRWAIDPESLILFTVEVARRDPRLFDEVLDWMTRNRALLSLQRLRNLSSRFPVDPGLVGAVVATAAGPSLATRWPIGDPETALAPVFDRQVLSFISELDTVFESYGYGRPRVGRSGKSDEPDVRAPVNLAFQLRLLFGPGSRSEVMRILLTFVDGPLDAARIADEAGFSKRNVSESLTALVGSRVVKARWSGNERTYLTYRKKWAELLEIGPSADEMPSFVPWTHLLPALLEILMWLEKKAEIADSDYLISSSARDLIERVAPDLETAGLAVPSSRSFRGAAYLPAFVGTVESALVAIGAGRSSGSA